MEDLPPSYEEAMRLPQISTSNSSIENNIAQQMRNKKEFLKSNFTYSKIQTYWIKNTSGEIISSGRKHYMPIVVDIWKTMNVDKIINYTTLQVSRTKSKSERWISEISLSYKSTKVQKVIHEIINMVQLNGYNLDIEILLKNGQVTNLKIDF